MKRIEEIEKASNIVFKTKFGRRTAFIRGAQWADQHPKMDNVVEAEVMYPASSSTLQLRYKLPKDTKLKYGDKVKIMIISS